MPVRLIEILNWSYLYVRTFEMRELKIYVHSYVTYSLTFMRVYNYVNSISGTFLYAIFILILVIKISLKDSEMCYELIFFSFSFLHFGYSK